MRGFGSNKVLGLAVGERGVTACELTRAGAAARASAAEFVYPAGVAADDWAAIGKALGEFLRQHRIGARRAVVGLPLKWAVVKPKEVPPSSPQALQSMLRLQAERDFAMEPQDLVIEYAGEASPNAQSTVLLLAVPRKRLDGVLKMAEAAGVKVEAVTLSAVALAEATARVTQGEGAVLHVGAGVAELSVQHRGQPRVLRHLRAPVGAAAAVGGAGIEPPGPEGEGAPGAAGGAGGAAPVIPPRDPAAALTLELRQVLSLMPQNGTAGDLALWDGVGLGDAPRAWADAFGVAVREQSLEALGVTNGPSAAGTGGAGRFAPAAALGLLALQGGAVVPDLLDSRLVERKPSRAAKPIVWGVLVGVVVALGIAFAWYDLSSQRNQIAVLKTKLAEIQPELKRDEATIARVSYAQQWKDQEPRFLACLRDLTAMFPDDGQIWATSLSLNDDGRGRLEAQSTSSDAPKLALRKLEDHPHFAEVNVRSIQNVGRNTTDQGFAITFRYTGAPPLPGAAPATAPAAAGSRPMNTGRPGALDRTGPASGPASAPASSPISSPTSFPASSPAPAPGTPADRSFDRPLRGNR